MKKIYFLFALAVAPVSAVSAFACQACMEMSQYSDADPVPLPPHVPADIRKLPKLNEDDVKFITGLEDGKRYALIGNYIADKTIRDIWARLMTEAAINDLLRPRVSDLCDGLRERAKKAKKPSAKDKAAAEHLFRDISAAAGAADRLFLKNYVEPEG
jgi:hypothetical protein